ncbi:hypothetical protein R6231_14220 [Bacillus cytotoxicus]|uniref:hypothetical protein n=1 Tax=Bacillus cereus group TaxID=86661 RepID=UPI000B96E126|nr:MULTISPECIES: hypothetical protein [Bacillus cereus group]AWC30971.1 hypothetical protein CG483_022390 [Bacillus cytotoxicus]AWC35078.1 hypothetical protein CG482_022765 [Bacillus cytotoxicus]AWC39044.1 hypothetical protein CG481_022355 [Bacillus cytotoxicus]AWC43063.1 hypothetical protein CG480_022225 [Bacillus cytotoxicus]AWC47024.1 hypothetical protein CG479_021725 [Bacillus cytotoxicus]
MDIHVRNVDPYYVKEIDKRCRQIGEKLGRRYYRGEYINEIFREHFDGEYKRNKEDKFDEAIGNVIVTLERQENKLQEYIDVTNELVASMVKLHEG